MLKREGASLDGHLAPAGERSPVATEAIITSRTVNQNPVVGIAVILQADIEDTYLKAASSRVVRRVRRSASDRRAAQRERRTRRQIAGCGHSWTVVACGRRWKSYHTAGVAWVGRDAGYVSRAGDARARRLIDGDGRRDGLHINGRRATSHARHGAGIGRSRLA